LTQTTEIILKNS